MTLSTQSSRADYTGDGTTVAFPYTFKIPAAADLDVYVNLTLMTLTTDYTVSGAGSASGGTVTFPTAPVSGSAIALVRGVAYTQETAYPDPGPFPASSHENALDKVTMLVQQLLELLTRAWRFAAGSPFAAAGYTVDEPSASKYLRIKSDCSGIEYVALTATGTYADPVTTKGDLIVGGTTGVQERLGITLGSTLVADTDTGKPAWKPGLSVALTNKFDAALSAGDVAIIDTTCDRAVRAGNQSGCVGVFVIAPAAVGDDCLAIFQYSGLIRNVKAQGAIARGQYVRKSATTQAVEDSGGAMGVHPPPCGTFALAVTAAAGGVVDVLSFGFTMPSAWSPVTSVPFTKSVGAGEEILATITLPANTLVRNGQAVKIKAWFSHGLGAGTRDYRLRFGGIAGTAVSFITGNTCVSVGTVLDSLVIRSAANTQQWVGTAIATQSSTCGKFVMQAGSAAATDTSPIDVIATATTSAGFNDVLLGGMIVETMN